MTRVKICGITRVADAECAILEGADALGFVLEPSSPRYVADYAALLDAATPFVSTVAVFGRFRIGEYGGFSVIQAFDPPTRKDIKVVRDGKLPEDDCAAVLLDTHDENALGGTGCVGDWDAAAELVKISQAPIILAGGLTPENVHEAIHKVRPYAVDVSSGVESKPGVKDHSRIKDFIQAVRDAG